MILTHGANSLTRGGGDVPAGFTDVYSVGLTGGGTSVGVVPVSDVTYFEIDFYVPSSMDTGSGNYCSILRLTDTISNITVSNIYLTVRVGFSEDNFWYIAPKIGTGSETNINYGATKYGRHKLIFDNGTVSIDGTVISTTASCTPITGSYYLWPAGHDNGGRAQNIGIISVKIKDSQGQTQISYVSCKRNMDDLPGFWSDQFGSMVSTAFKVIDMDET